LCAVTTASKGYFGGLVGYGQVPGKGKPEEEDGTNEFAHGGDEVVGGRLAAVRTVLSNLASNVASLVFAVHFRVVRTSDISGGVCTAVWLLWVVGT